MKLLRMLCFIIGLGASQYASAAVNVCASLNIYADVAKIIGADLVKVTSILHSPSQDPHLFTTNASAAIAINQADIIIVNGADYDPWMKPLLAVGGKPSRHIISIANISPVDATKNPHLWFKPETMPAFAKAFSEQLITLEPEHKTQIIKRLKAWQKDYTKVLKKVAVLKKRYQNTPVTAVEPVFNYMTNALGFKMLNTRFQMQMMNELPPSPKDIAAFESSLRDGSVVLLIQNPQIDGPLLKRIQQLAQKHHIPTLTVGELLPANISFTAWLLSILDKLDTTLVQKDNA